MYAGFWKRTAAYLLDYVIFVTAVWIINLIVGISMALLISSQPKDTASPLPFVLLLGYLVILLAVYLFYYVYLESSSWQATPGKLALGIKVTDLHGNRISFWRSLGRHAGFLVSSLTACIGYMMCGWTAHKQCLHDMMADCLVVDRNYDPQQAPEPAKTPAWTIALAVLGTILMLSFLLGIGCAMTLPSFMNSVEKSRAAVIAARLQQTAVSQQRYKMAHGHFARQWKQLEGENLPKTSSFFYCMEGKQEFSAQDPYAGCGGARTWVLTLGPDAVTAWRTNSWKYRITVPYMSRIPRCLTDERGQEQRLCKNFNASRTR